VVTQIQNPFETIADGLAEKGYAVVDSFLSPSAIQDVLSLDLFREEYLKKAGIGKENKQIQEGIRGDYIQWIDKTNAPRPIKNYTDTLDALRLFLNQSLYLSLKDYEVHLALYPAGSFYKRHLDQFKSDDHRKLSVILYLNTDWTLNQGGQLRMFLDNASLDILPVAGRLVCFRSDLIEHEVLPATRTRMSITGWMLDQLADLRHI
jgi:SM-20-related protein